MINAKYIIFNLPGTSEPHTFDQRYRQLPEEYRKPQKTGCSITASICVRLCQSMVRQQKELVTIIGFIFIKIKNKIRNKLPIKAASATNDPIQANSSVSGTAVSGESVSVTSCSFGFTGDVQPRVVPTAKLDKFTVVTR